MNIDYGSLEVAIEDSPISGSTTRDSIDKALDRGKELYVYIS